MGFAAVAQASGSQNRAEAELNLLNKENQNRLRVENSVAQARGGELDAIAREASNSVKQQVDTYFKLGAAEEAKEAAKFAFWGSFANLASKVGGGILGGKGGFATAIDSIGAAFATLGAYFAMQGAKDEVKLLTLQFGQLSESAKEDQNMVKALDGNPIR